MEEKQKRRVPQGYDVRAWVERSEIINRVDSNGTSSDVREQAAAGISESNSSQVWQ